MKAKALRKEGGRKTGKKDVSVKVKVGRVEVPILTKKGKVEEVARGGPRPVVGGVGERKIEVEVLVRCCSAKSKDVS